MKTFLSARGFRFASQDEKTGASYHYGYLRRIRDEHVSRTLRNPSRLNALTYIQTLTRGITHPQATAVEDWFKSMLFEFKGDTGRLRYLHDTLRFITEGQRRLPTAGYQALVTFESGISDVSTPRNLSVGRVPDSDYDKALYQQALDMVDYCKGNLLHLWVSQNGGFIDLLETFIFMLQPEANR